MKNNLIKATNLIILMILLFSFIAPTTAYATERNFWDGFDVDINATSTEVEFGANKSETEGFVALIASLKNFIVGIAGVATVIAVGFFIMNFMKLGGSNSRTRSEAISGLIYSGIATAGLGSVTLIAAMFYGMIGQGTPKAS